MFETNFNPNGFIAPKTKQEYIALLDEAIRMADELADMWSATFKPVEQARALTA